MNEHSGKKILSTISTEDFIGRAQETETILNHLQGENSRRGMLVLSPPSAGLSEILFQVYDRLFNEQQIIPFYFAFSRNDKTVKECVVRFLQNFLVQVVAFRRNDAELLNVSPDVCEINELTAPVDAHWIHQLTKTCRKESDLNDQRNFVRQALSAPLRAATNDVAVAVLFDDLQNAPAELIEELKEIYRYSKAPFLFAGKRRFLLGAMQSGNMRLQDTEILRLDDLSTDDARFLTEKLAAKAEIKINEQTRDLIVRQLGAKPRFIEAFLSTAREQEKDLESFQAVEQVYAGELFGRSLGKFYDDIFSEAANDLKTQKQIIKLLHDGFEREDEKIGTDAWRENLALEDAAFTRLIKFLHIREIINLSSEIIHVSGENSVLEDYTEVHYRLESLHESRALVFGDILKNSLERAPKLMAQSYRRAAVIGLQGLISVFNCQDVALNLFDYAEFKRIDEPEEKTFIKLPQIIYAANGEAFYPPIANIADEKRSAVAFGFENGDHRQESEIVWVAAEIDSKLEATAELTEFWCDRLEMIALMCNFSKYQLWLVTPEGFLPEAIEILHQRNAFGSSRKQVENLIKILKAENVLQKKAQSNEYEMILPMGDETELIAAGAVEEIARRHHFASKDITKIKTALVEAYINAAEHSLSPDRKIYQKLTIDDDKIVITISNRGIKLPPEKAVESIDPIEPGEGRRGWGLKLMRTLMDQVKIEQVDDGTRISMTKYLNKS